MAATFRIDAHTDETAMWDALRRDGTVDVIHGNGLRETLTGPVYWISPENFEDGDDVNGCEFNFMTGCASGDGRTMSDAMNTPDKVLRDMFKGRLPAGMTIDWNAAETTHFVETRSPMTVGQAKAVIVPILEANGFRPQP